MAFLISTYFMVTDRNLYYFVTTDRQSGVLLIEVFNKRNKPNTTYFSVRIRLRCLTEVSAE